MIPARPIVLRSKPEPSFARDFAATKALNNGVGPAIAFSRGSNATYFDANGVLQYAPNNLVRNGNATGSTTGIIGSGGALPTNWSRAGTTGINQQIVGTGTANGMSYIDIRISGTNTSGATGFPLIAFETTTGIAAIFGLPYLASVWVEVVAGSWTGFALNRIELQELTSGGVVNGQNYTSSLGTSFTRYSIARTVSNSTSAYVRPLIGLSLNNGSSVDVTMRIYGGQVELTTSSTPSDYFPTTGTAGYYGPRFDTDPVTKQSKGLLIEEQRVNLHYFSNNLTQSTAWGVNNTSVVASGTGIDGLTANRVIETAATSAAHSIFNYGGNASAFAFSYTSGLTYTFSAYLKKGIGSSAPDWVQIAVSSSIIANGYANFNLTTGVVGNSSVNASMTPVGNGWYRCVVTATSNATVTSYGILIAGCNNTNGTTRTPAYDGNVNADWYVGQTQGEQGSFATSYIPTGASQATRSADVAAITGNDFLNFYSRTGSTLFCKASIYQGCPASINDNSNRFQMISSGAVPPTGLNIRLQSSANTVNTTNPATFTGLSFASSAIGIDANYLQVAVNGRTLTSPSYLGLVPPANQLQIGTGISTNYICGCISQIAYYPRRLNDQQLIALTR